MCCPFMMHLSLSVFSGETVTVSNTSVISQPSTYAIVIGFALVRVQAVLLFKYLYLPDSIYQEAQTLFYL